MKTLLQLTVFLIVLLPGQKAYSQSEVIELDREAFCARVNELRLANAELLGSAAGFEMVVGIFERRAQATVPELREANDFLLSAAKKASDAAEPFYEICAQD